MAAIAYQPVDVPKQSAQPGLAWWIGASLALHALALLWLLLQPDQDPMRLGERSIKDKPPIEIVQLKPLDPARMAEPKAIADKPQLDRPPPRVQPRGEIEVVDPAVLMRFLASEAAREKREDGGAGMSWATCSLLPAQRRVMEPACDGFLLTHRAEAGIAVSLEAPGREELVKKFEKEKPVRKAVGEDSDRDTSYRDQSDDYHGPKPWE